MEKAFKRAARRQIHRGKKGRLLTRSGKVITPVYCLIELGVVSSPGTDTQVAEARDFGTFLVDEVGQISVGDRFEVEGVKQLITVEEITSVTAYKIQVVIDNGGTV